MHLQSLKLLRGRVLEEIHLQGMRRKAALMYVRPHRQTDKGANFGTKLIYPFF